MSQFEQKAFNVYAAKLGRDPQICRDVGGHWVNPRMKRCNNCFLRLREENGVWVEAE